MPLLISLSPTGSHIVLIMVQKEIYSMNHHEGQRKKIANPHNLEAELENILHFFASSFDRCYYKNMAYSRFKAVRFGI